MTTRSIDDATSSGEGESRVAIPISAEDARAAAEAIGRSAEAIGRSAPDAARASRDAVVDTMQWIERGTDDRIATGATLSLGLALGMLIGGAPRALVALALLPATALTMVLVERWRGARPSGQTARPAG